MSSKGMLVTDPIALFNKYWKKSLSCNPMQNKSAVCVTTVDPEGFPSSRFVDLKKADMNGFVFCTSLASDKACHIDKNNKVSLCLWWEHIDLQVRISGHAYGIDDDLAEHYWNQRSQDAKITSCTFEQSKVLDDLNSLSSTFAKRRSKLKDSMIARPANWGGFCVSPVKLEFLHFKRSRLHERVLFEFKQGVWSKVYLQP